jgi:hypothetical protein
MDTGITGAPARLSAVDIISAVRALAPEIQSRGDEIAALRRLSIDLVQKLKAAGSFRMAMPAAWGGPEMTPRVHQRPLMIALAAVWCNAC